MAYSNLTMFLEFAISHFNLLKSTLFPEKPTQFLEKATWGNGVVFSGNRVDFLGYRVGFPLPTA